jgi:hypothetical protein
MITLKDAGLIILGISLLALIFSGICLLHNLTATAKSMNKILKDTEIISGIAAERSKDADKLIGEVSKSVGSATETVKLNKAVISAIVIIANSLAFLKNLFKKGKKTKTD